MKRSNKRDLFGLAPDGVYLAFDITAETVSSYLTISPLPVPRQLGPSAVYFLWHFPYPDKSGSSALRSVLSCGVRTFLIPASRDAIAWTTLDCFFIKTIQSSPVSRILSSPDLSGGGDHLSSPAITDGVKQPTRPAIPTSRD